MKRPTAVIAEDEPLLRTEIREALTSLWPDLEVRAEAADGGEAVRAIDLYSPDVVFLDVRMPGMNGLDVAAYVGGRAHIVFITAFDQHAMAAFDHGAVDYLLKPLSMARLTITVQRLQHRLREPPADLGALVTQLRATLPAPAAYLQWLSVSRGDEIHIVTVAEVCYLRADHKYTSVATDKSTFLLNSSLKEMKERLDPTRFWQIHRSIIVNVAAIEVIYRSFRGSLEVKLKDRSEILPVSQAHAHRFRPG
jgi:DNA-binding LytR/AlgR family response regulator